MTNGELTPEKRAELINKIDNIEVRAYGGPPRSDRETALCRCGSISQMTKRFPPSWVDKSHAVTLLQCATCNQTTLILEEGEWLNTSSHYSTFSRVVGVLWWPATGGAAPLDPDAAIPDQVRKFWEEANRCISVQALHGAAVMLRNCLAVIAVDCGSSAILTEKNLDTKLKKLAEERPEVAFLADYMSAIKAIGNAGAHPEDWPPVEEDQVAVARDLVRIVMRTFYEEPARVKNLLPKRAPKG